MSGRRLDGSLLGANLVVSRVRARAGLRGMKGLPRDDTGSGEGSLHRSFFEVPIDASGKPERGLDLAFSNLPQLFRVIDESRAIDLVLFHVYFGSRKQVLLEAMYYFFLYTRMHTVNDFGRCVDINNTR